MNPAQRSLLARYGTVGSTHSVLDHPVLTRMLGRRSCRRYTAERLPTELVDALLDVAFSASSKSDYQQASAIVVSDPARRRRIAELVPAMPWIGLAPAFIVFCADASRMEKICALRGHSIRNRNLEAFFNASIDAALVMQTFILACEEVGLGSCPISAVRGHLEEVRTILSLPDGVLPIAGLCVGYPADPGAVSMRLPRCVSRHTDTYDDTALHGAIDSYDRERAERAPIARDKQRAASMFGYADFYGWSEDKARQMLVGEGSEFGTTVRALGFTLD